MSAREETLTIEQLPSAEELFGDMEALEKFSDDITRVVIEGFLSFDGDFKRPIASMLEEEEKELLMLSHHKEKIYPQPIKNLLRAKLAVGLLELENIDLKGVKHILTTIYAQPSSEGPYTNIFHELDSDDEDSQISAMVSFLTLRTLEKIMKMNFDTDIYDYLENTFYDWEDALLVIGKYFSLTKYVSSSGSLQTKNMLVSRIPSNETCFIEDALLWYPQGYFIDIKPKEIRKFTRLKDLIQNDFKKSMEVSIDDGIKYLRKKFELFEDEERGDEYFAILTKLAVDGKIMEYPKGKALVQSMLVSFSNRVSLGLVSEV